MVTPRARVIRSALENLSETVDSCWSRKYAVWIGESIRVSWWSESIQCGSEDLSRDAATFQASARRSVQRQWMSRCSTWQNASLKEPSENAEYPWRTTIPKEELEAESAPLGSNRTVAISDDHEIRLDAD